MSSGKSRRGFLPFRSQDFSDEVSNSDQSSLVPLPDASLDEVIMRVLVASNTGVGSISFSLAASSCSG